MATVLETKAALKQRPTQTVPLFVYGTLREGGTLAHLLHKERTQTGTVHGYDMFTHNYRYPFIVRTDDSVTGWHPPVVGEVAWCHVDEQFWQTCEMECRSGYEIEMVRVYTDDLPFPIPAMCFVADAQRMGPAHRITTNDWSRRLDNTPQHH